MAKKLPAGPYAQLDLGGGVTAPFYIIPFDKKGRATGPNTQQQLIEEAAAGDFSDLFLFSHGWNNDWKVSTQRYRDFIAGFQAVRDAQGIDMPAGYKPLLVGIFWPSTALVFGKAKGPGFAAAGEDEDADSSIGAGLAELDEIASELASDGQVEEFHALAQQERLDPAQARRLAQLLVSLMGEQSDPFADPVSDGEGAMDAEAFLDAWQSLGKKEPSAVTDGAFGFPAEEGFPADEAVDDSPEVAGISSLDPRKAVRMFTVWKMKDRAGVVGGNGVAKLLRGLLSAHGGRTHLLGHSYGAKVVLSALCAPPAPPRQVDSVLLLQPAVNRWCFADEVPKRGGPGAYHEAPARCRLPLFSTYTADDSALTKLFHLSVRRGKDLGEGPQLAGGELPAPSIYSALGGFGPAGRAAVTKKVELLGPSDRYDFSGGERIYAVHADGRITGHGEISNDFTWWTLHQLVRRAAATD